MKEAIMRAGIAKMMIVAISLWCASAAFAQQNTGQQRTPVDLGKVEYEANCATCHGLKAKGDGPTKPFLTRIVPDLSILAKNNNGILPFAAMYDVIVGEKEVGSHGSRDMPVWGREYRIQAAERYLETQYDPEAYVRARVLAIIEYINRLQEK
jgi:mono/diheme cytochrome c family protein